MELDIYAVSQVRQFRAIGHTDEVGVRQDINIGLGDLAIAVHVKKLKPASYPALESLLSLSLPESKKGKWRSADAAEL